MGRRIEAAAFRLLVEDIFLFADIHFRRALGHFEIVVTDLQHLPEFEMFALAMTGHVFRRHAEGEGLQLHCLLAALEGVARKTVDFKNLRIRHRITAGGGAGTVDHQIGAVAAIGGIIAVRKAGIDGEVILRVRIEMRRRQVIKTFRRLPVTLFHLGAELSGPGAYLVFGDFVEAVVALGLPDFQRAFFLEDADHDRRGAIHALFVDLGQDGRRQRVIDLVLDVGHIAFDGFERVVATGKNERSAGKKCKMCQTHDLIRKTMARNGGSSTPSRVYFKYGINRLHLLNSNRIRPAAADTSFDVTGLWPSWGDIKGK